MENGLFEGQVVGEEAKELLQTMQSGKDSSKSLLATSWEEKR
jgi:hypothetical protein